MTGIRFSHHSLVRRDRQQNVRRAFRSFPLHELPLAQRTINPFAFYESYLSRGRIVYLCTNALLLGFGKEERPVSAATVNEAAGELVA